MSFFKDGKNTCFTSSKAIEQTRIHKYNDLTLIRLIYLSKIATKDLREE